MAIRIIRTEEDPILRKVSRPVTKFDEKLWAILDDMHETMVKANGVGLAAVQVGLLRRAVIIDVDDGSGVIVFENVPLSAQTTLRASCGECSDEITIFQTAQEESSYRLPEGGQGGRVVNWFLQEKQKDDCFSILSTAQEILENPKASAALQEMKPAIYQLLTGDMSIPLGLTLNTFLGRDAKDPEEILRINHALQEIPKSGIQDRRD